MQLNNNINVTRNSANANGLCIRIRSSFSKSHFTWLSESFWVTVCKTVRPMLSDRCPVCLSCLTVTLVYCGQTVGQIKMILGMRVSLGPGHIVLDGDPDPPPQRGTAFPPNFQPVSVVAKWLDGSRCHLVGR